MKKKMSFLILAGLVLIPAIGADVAVVTKFPGGAQKIDSIDPNTAAAFYDTYIAPKITAQIQTEVTTAVATALATQVQPLIDAAVTAKVAAARSALWQDMNGAMQNNAALLQGQRADEEAALLNSLIAGAKLRLEAIGRPFPGSPTP
jgi:hypothetical protein